MLCYAFMLNHAWLLVLDIGELKPGVECVCSACFSWPPVAMRKTEHFLLQPVQKAAWKLKDQQDRWSQPVVWQVWLCWGLRWLLTIAETLEAGFQHTGWGGERSLLLAFLLGISVLNPSWSIYFNPHKSLASQQGIGTLTAVFCI